MSNLIDSHVNFGHELLKNSVSDICKDAQENNIERILSINSNIYEFQKDINLIKGFNFVDITLGHHPNNTLDIKPEEIKTLLNINKEGNFFSYILLFAAKLKSLYRLVLKYIFLLKHHLIIFLEH